jgi:branched-chain amino acid aminotransferase
MLLVDFHDGRGWSDARVVPYGPLALDPAAAVLHYGQAMFEGAKAIRGDDGGGAPLPPRAPLRAHGQRGAAAVHAVARPRDARPRHHRAAEGRGGVGAPRRNTALYIRPTLVATEPFLGVRPANQYLLYVILSPVGSYYGGDTLKPVRIWVETQQTRAAKGASGP